MKINAWEHEDGDDTIKNTHKSLAQCTDKTAVSGSLGQSSPD